MVKIVLDAGHGGTDPGAVYEGRQEKDDNLQLVFDVGAVLENNGIDVEYTRVTDVYQSPYEKAAMANQSGADYFVSIHRNARDIPNTEGGVETLLYSTEDSVKKDMAEAINRNLEAIGFVNRGVIARPNLVVLRDTDMPALLVEAGFIDSETDNALYDANQAAIADAIAYGILAGLPETANYGATEEKSGDSGIAADQRDRSGGSSTDEKQAGEQRDTGEKNEYRENSASRRSGNNGRGGSDTDEERAGEQRSAGERNEDHENGAGQRKENGGSNTEVERAGEQRSVGERNEDHENGAGQRKGNGGSSRDEERVREQRSAGEKDEYRENDVGEKNGETGRNAEKRENQTWRVQVGVYRNPSNARMMLNHLEIRGHQAYMLYRNGLYYVQVGSYPDISSAIAEERRLKRAGFPTLIVTE